MMSPFLPSLGRIIPSSCREMKPPTTHSLLTDQLQLRKGPQDSLGITVKSAFSLIIPIDIVVSFH